MKCQKCNKNEANVQYRETVNGRTREICLCSECAAEAGLLDRTGRMFEQMEREMIDAFAAPFGGSLLGRSRPGMLRSLFTLPEAGGLFETGRAGVPEPQPVKGEEQKEQPTPEEETENSLKAKLLDAIADERYEDAAKYRDKIKKLKGE